MSGFKDFSKEETEMVAAFPFRVGVYVSRSDDVEGAKDDQKEIAALRMVLESIAELEKKKPFVAAVIQQTLAGQSSWPVWAKQNDRVLEDAPKVAELVKSKLDAVSTKDYLRSLFYIGRVVAQAYGEHKGPAEIPEALIVQWAQQIGATFDQPSTKLDNPENISDTENAALKKLSAALKSA